MAKSPKVAVLLAGCGHLDGAEVREAVLTLLALDHHGATYQCIAPNVDQHDVINHVTGQPVPGATRNVLEEASRIARKGQCLDLAQARAQHYDALIMPGGFGVAKNLCTFALKGADGDVLPEVETFILGFFEARKPVGAICIAPALVALTLSGQESVDLTLGNDAASAREIVIDEAHKLVTTPAYMFDDARLSDVFVGIERCVAEVLKRV
jgi:enhancing lycopene biosynthesis protein 2